MKIYLAGTFADQADLRDPADRIWRLGHEVVSTWLQEIQKPAGMDGSTFKRKLAMKDIAEVVNADLIILDNRQISGGKNCE